DTEVSSLELRKALRQVLPDYMVPQQFEPIDEIPLTPNGKVDRKQLPDITYATAGRSPSGVELSETESSIAAIWCDLVGVPGPVAKSENFFEMGGHSLLAVKAIALIETKLGVRVSTRQLVMDPLSAIAKWCEDNRLKVPESPSAERGFLSRWLKRDRTGTGRT
ncbi:MAG: phosphopantetheine-binding protein, partial [Pseudomonadota bacterium]